MNKFWMVLGGGQPTFRHETLEEACREAERLARLYMSSTFVVLEAIAEVKKTDVNWTRLGEPGPSHEGIPF